MLWGGGHIGHHVWWRVIVPSDLVRLFRGDLRTLSLRCDSPHDNLCGVRDLSPRGKGNSCQTKLLGRLSYEKIRRYNNSSPYMTARWLPQHIPPLNFLVENANIPQNMTFWPNLKCDIPGNILMRTRRLVWVHKVGY